MVRIVSPIYEGDMEHPVLVHHFIGETLEEAQGYYESHLSSDSFFRACLEVGNFEGRFPCREERWTEVWNGNCWELI